VAAAVGAVVLVTDGLVPLLLAPAARTTLSAWNWRTGAVLICVLSAYRPTREVVALAAAHAGVAVAFGLHAGTASHASLVVLATTCAVPSLIAANYLVVYTFGLRRRKAAVDAYTRSVELRAAEQAQRQSVLDKVESIRGEIVVLLETAAEGDLASEGIRTTARELSASLRRELDETRTRGWLVPAPEVDVLGPVTLLGDDERAALAALTELLTRHGGLGRIAVTVSSDAATADTDPDDARTAEVTVVATGRGSASAYADAAIRAAADAVGAVLWHDDETGSLVVETRCPPCPPLARTPAHSGNASHPGRS
jgi:hypothetical protein